MILKCVTKNWSPDLTFEKKYKVIQMTDNEKLAQVKNDKGKIDWYPTFIFNY
jgi:hypothetical protein